MGGISVWQLLIVVVLFGAFFFPLLLTLLSKRAKGAEKVGWAILVCFTSWMGYALFLIVTHLLKSANHQQR